MTSRTLNDAASAPAALTAFLRGVERRGAVFAQLQVGDSETGDRALVAAMRAFRLAAGRLTIAEWPRQFWGLLLATGELRELPAAPHWEDAFAFLGGTGRGPRAALLLRLVAGLAEADAASVLGVARPTYRLALQRALPHLDDGQPDAEGWRALGEVSRQAVRDLPVARLAHLARIREAAIRGVRLDPPTVALAHKVPDPAAAPASGPARWRMPGMIAAGLLCLAALAATFVLPIGGSRGPSSRIEVTSLPPAAAPRARYDAATALLTHPDFDLLAEDGSAVARDPAFYAWLAAGAPVPPREAGNDPAPVFPAASADAPETGSETDDVP